MGPPGKQWRYSPQTRTYDLTRGAAERAHVPHTTRGPPDISVAIAPTHSALVVIDMQNYFLHPTCNDFPSEIAAARRTAEAVKICRKSKMKVSIPQVFWTLYAKGQVPLNKRSGTAQVKTSRLIIR